MAQQNKKVKKNKGIQTVNLFLFFFALLIGLSFSASLARLIEPEIDPGYQDAISVEDGIPLYYPHTIIAWHIKVARIGDYTLIATEHPGVALSPFICILITFLITKIFLKFISLFRGAKNQNTFTHGSAAWGTKKDLKNIGLLNNSGTIYGQTQNAEITVKENKKIMGYKKYGKLIADSYDTDNHTMIIAQSRSGKGIGPVITTLLSYPGSVVVLDIKGENWDITAGFRSQYTYTYRFNPMEPSQSESINPLDFIRREKVETDAQVMAEIILTERPDEKDPHWIQSAQRVLTGLIIHIVTQDFSKPIYNPDKPLPVLYDPNRPRALSTIAFGIDDPNYNFQLIAETGLLQSENEEVATIARGITQTNEKEFASILNVLRRGISIYRNKQVSQVMNNTTVDLDKFTTLDKPVSLYLCANGDTLKLVLPIYNLITTIILNKKRQKFTGGKATDKYKVLFLLDEFPMLGKNKIIEDSLGFSTGYGIKYMIIIQTFLQLDQAYGKINTFRDNTHVKVLFSSGSHETSTEISKTLGKETILKEVSSISGNKSKFMLDNINNSIQELGRDLLTPDEVSRLEYQYGIILSTGAKPVMFKKLAYYCDNRFKNRAGLPIIEHTNPTFNSGSSIKTTPITNETIDTDAIALTVNKENQIKKEMLNDQSSFTIADVAQYTNESNDSSKTENIEINEVIYNTANNENQDQNQDQDEDQDDWRLANWRNMQQ